MQNVLNVRWNSLSMAQQTNHKQSRLKFIIFSLIGIFNTIFDIALYIAFFNVTHSIIVANIISTSAALVGSYLLNSRVTFKAKTWTARSFVGFIVVTVFGLWVLQTGAIYLVTRAQTHLPEHTWQLLGSLEHVSKTLLPKLLATAVTFVWNYLWYSRVIFKNASGQESAVLALDEL